MPRGSGSQIEEPRSRSVEPFQLGARHELRPEQRRHGLSGERDAAPTVSLGQPFRLVLGRRGTSLENPVVGKDGFGVIDDDPSSRSGP